MYSIEKRVEERHQRNGKIIMKKSCRKAAEKVPATLAFRPGRKFRARVWPARDMKCFSHKRVIYYILNIMYYINMCEVKIVL